MTTTPPPWAGGPVAPGHPVPGPAVSTPGYQPEAGKPVGAGGYWLGSVLMVIGVVVAIVVFVVGVSRAVDAFAFPDVVDAAGEVWIDDPGGKVIFVVGPEPAGGSFVAVPGLSVTDPDGDSVRTAHYDGSRSTTEVDEWTGTTREAIAVATFHADQPGRYRLTAMNIAPGSTLGVGEGFDGNFALLTLGVIGGGLAVLVGLVVVIMTAVRRHRQQPMPPAGPYAYPYQQPYQQPYPSYYPSAPPGSPAPPRYPIPPPGIAPPGPPPPGSPTAPPGGPAGQWWEAPAEGTDPQSGPRGAGPGGPG